MPVIICILAPSWNYILHRFSHFLVYLISPKSARKYYWVQSLLFLGGFQIYRIHDTFCKYSTFSFFLSCNFVLSSCPHFKLAWFILKFYTTTVIFILFQFVVENGLSQSEHHTCSAATFQLPPQNRCRKQHNIPSASDSSMVNFFPRILSGQQMSRLFFNFQLPRDF